MSLPTSPFKRQSKRLYESKASKLHYQISKGARNTSQLPANRINHASEQGKAPSYTDGTDIPTFDDQYI